MLLCAWERKPWPILERSGYQRESSPKDTAHALTQKNANCGTHRLPVSEFGNVEHPARATQSGFLLHFPGYDLGNVQMPFKRKVDDLALHIHPRPGRIRMIRVDDLADRTVIQANGIT